MADLLACWRYDNYQRDLEEGAAFNFNSWPPRLHSAISLGGSVRLITGRRETGRAGTAFYVVACMWCAQRRSTRPATSMVIFVWQATSTTVLSALSAQGGSFG
jgi:hypothetical protein